VLALLFCTTHLHNAEHDGNTHLATLTDSISIECGATTTAALFHRLLGAGTELLTRLTPDWTLSRRESSSCWCCWFGVGGDARLSTVKPLEAARGRCCGGVCSPTAKCRAGLPFFLAVDRIYQFYRFGSFTNTYVSISLAKSGDRSHAARELPWSSVHEGVSARSSSRRSHSVRSLLV